MSAEALAAELEVSVRTVYRTIDQLSAAGVPVYGERGRTGGFRLLDGYRTRLTGLTAGEAQALFLAGLPGPASELGLGDVMADAQLKLLAALPDAWRADAQRVSSRFHLDPMGWFRGPASVDHLPAIAAAVWDERRLTIRYRSAGVISQRTIEPLGLVLKAGVWYVVARIPGAMPRTYRLSNVAGVDATDERFTRPADFRLADYWTASTRRYEAGVFRDTALVRVTPRGMTLLGGLGPAVAEAAERSAGEPDAQGWTNVVIPIESVEHAAGELLGLGAEIAVLAPPALRERLAETARALATLYA